MDPRLHVHIPYRMLRDEMAFLLARGLQPEIAFKGPELDAVDRGELSALGRQLRSAGLRVAVHAPFMDLNPGALDPLVKQATQIRVGQTLAAAERLGAHRVILHPGYDRWRYAGNEELWVEASLAFWRPFLRQAADAGLLLALENVFEDAPDNLVKLLAAVDSPTLGHCFDVGHWHMFCREKISLGAWFEQLGARVVHLHLHDNHGERDEHLPPGEGLICFDRLFSLIEHWAPAATMTLEAHDRQSLLRALVNIRPFLAP